MPGRATPWMTPARGGRAVLALLPCLAIGALAGPAGASTSAPAPNPVLGDWEGTGPGGVPLSFALSRGPAGVTLSALAVGFPEGCPVGARHTLAVGADHLRYSRSGAPVADAILLSGSATPNSIRLRGRLNGPRSVTLSVAAENQQLPCSWPRTLTWRAHPAHRSAVPDATWNAKVSGPGLGGTVTVRTAAGGRVVTSFQASYTCVDAAGNSGRGTVGSTPANEFISTLGDFASPAALQVNHRVPVQWSARFGAHGTLRGGFTDASPCTGAAVHASFAAGAPAHA